MSKEKKSIWANYWRVVLAGIAIALSFAMCMKGGIVQGLRGIDISFLFFPLLAMLTAVLISEVIGAVFTGSLVSRIRSSLYCLAAGLFFFLLLPGPPVPERFHPTAFPILCLSIIAAAYKLTGHFTKGLPAWSILAKVPAIILAGLIIWHLSSIALPSWRGVPVPAVLFTGFTLSAAACSLSALAFSKNPYLLRTGKSLGHPSAMFFLGIFLAFYFTSLRQPISEVLHERLAFAEWGIVCFLCGIGFLKLRSTVKHASKPVSFGTWAKHLQIVKMKEDRDLVDVSELVKDFVENGSKGGILVYLISAASGAGALRDRILEAVDGLVSYENKPVPSIAFRWEAERLKRENRKARRDILEKTIRRLGKL